MIFNNSNQYFESEKERNFYYKIFAGYICNEFVPGYELRMNKLVEIFNNPKFIHENFENEKIKLDVNDTHVSFDNHLYLFDGIADDRGEFADIFIQSKASNSLIMIEAKLHSDWSFEKDIVSNQLRIDKIKSKLPKANIYPILLITADKWKNAKTHTNSNLDKLRNNAVSNCRVVIWERIVDIIEDKKVKEFFIHQLQRNPRKSKYSFEVDWIKLNSNTK